MFEVKGLISAFSVNIDAVIKVSGKQIIENLNGEMRKYTKNKLSFSADDAIKKPVHLALTEITKNGHNQSENGVLF